MESKSELLDIKQASLHLKKKVTPSNISYLIQYARIKKAYNFLADDSFRAYIENYLDLDRSLGEWNRIQQRCQK